MPIAIDCQPPAFDELTRESYGSLLEEYLAVRKRAALLEMKLFDRSSERLRDGIEREGATLLPGLEDLLDEDVQQEESPHASAPPSDCRPRRKRQGGGRTKLPPDLPRVRREYYPDGLDAEKVKADPDLVVIGTEVSEQLACKQLEFYVIEHVRYKIARRSNPSQGVAIAPAPEKPIAKGMADATLLSSVVTDKFLYHQPLHRQEKRFQRFGLPMARSTLCDWVMEVADLLRPLHMHMIRGLLRSKFLHTDDTPVVLIGGPVKGRIWVYAGGEEYPYVVYLFSPNRRRVYARKILEDFTGYVHCDAYSGYESLFKERQGTLIELACWSHARRYFHNALKVGERQAWVVLELIGLLFKVERQANELNLRGEERKAFRLRYAPGLLADIRDWLDVVGSKALPKSQIGKGYTYLHNQWAALQRYLEDGDLSLTNNYAERLLRVVALGRNNWQFFAAESGGEAAAVLYSMIQSCLLSQVDPWLYFADVLNRLDQHPAADLVPDRWKEKFMAQACARYQASPIPPSK